MDGKYYIGFRDTSIVLVTVLVTVFDMYFFFLSFFIARGTTRAGVQVFCF